MFSNDPGYPSLNDPGDTLPVWLHRAGYRTGFIGKFLNNTVATLGGAKAPGFDRWFAYDNGNEYFDYTMTDQEGQKAFGSQPASYTTNVFTRQALEFTGAHPGKPFFLWLAYNAPHDAHEGRGHCKRLDPLVARGADYRRFADPRAPAAPLVQRARRLRQAARRSARCRS